MLEAGSDERGDGEDNSEDAIGDTACGKGHPHGETDKGNDEFTTTTAAS